MEFIRLYKCLGSPKKERNEAVEKHTACRRKFSQAITAVFPCPLLYYYGAVHLSPAQPTCSMHHAYLSPGSVRHERLIVPLFRKQFANWRCYLHRGSPKSCILVESWFTCHYAWGSGVSKVARLCSQQDLSRQYPGVWGKMNALFAYLSKVKKGRRLY